jgi:hypothetical protein
LAFLFVIAFAVRQRPLFITTTTLRILFLHLLLSPPEG